MLSDDAEFNMETEPTTESIMAGQLTDDVEAVHQLLDRLQASLELWTVASDPDSAYLIVADDIERWPRADPPVACA
jgi:hypothetical protein